MDLEILEEFSATNDPTIMKRKRTKRPRPDSSASSSVSGGGGGGESTSTTTTEAEDEDLAANCLILLARGGFSPPENKLRRRKYTEMATATGGNRKLGIDVYECKTCNRTFPSFQALGGHRASHKKPVKPSDQIDPKKSPSPSPSPLPSPDKLFTKINNTISTPSPPMMEKIHECSICGSEFGSGQALGGHMRRHRPPVKISSEKTRPVLGLDLDLNLPAPPEDGECPPPHMVFSAAAMVDCHY